MNYDASYGVTPLGLTIAKKQLERPDEFEREQQKQKQKKKRTTQKQIVTTSWTKKSEDPLKKKKNPSWVSLVEGVTLYALCLFVPTLLGILMRLEWSQIQSFGELVEEKICHYSPYLCWHVFGKVLPSPEPEITFKNFAPDTDLSDIYVVLALTLGMAFFRVLLVHWLVPNHLAPQQMEALVRCKSIHLLSSEYKQSLTPRESPREVISWESLQKTKTDADVDAAIDTKNDNIEKQLLKGKLALPLVPDWEDERGSSSGGTGNDTATSRTRKYHTERKDQAQTENVDIRPRTDLGLSIDTPTNKNNRRAVGMESLTAGGFLGTCSPMPGSTGDIDDEDDNSQQHFNIEQEEDGNDGYEKERTATPPPIPSRQSFNQQVEEDEEDPSSLWKRRGSAASLAAAAAAAVQEEEHHSMEDHPQVEGSDEADVAPVPTSQRLFAAPRYATAVFRLLYCTLSCSMAWYLFKDADFWPWYVGGHGSTARCWDLSGSLSLAKNLDSDFDHRNTVLRRFFLVQASYHLHSGAFHVASVVLLYLLKQDSDNRNVECHQTIESKANKRKNLFSLLRSLVHPRALLQHSLSLVWLSVSYIFSSLRRLGAIGMFALDMSSWALHLLQSCLNAPSDSVLSQPRVIRAVWLLMVCPSFLYFRFLVWPMVGYSAMVESERWLAQLESTLVPGSAVWFRRSFLMWMLTWIGFHAIHFKRLVFHPHIQRIMNAKDELSTTMGATSNLSSDTLYGSGRL